MTKPNVVVAGGGTAGWMTAIALVTKLGKTIDVTLIESAEIPTVGVGEATIPPLQIFHALMAVDEGEFIQNSGATIKLGIEFEGWKSHSTRYFHSFGKLGRETFACDFQHFYLKGRELGLDIDIDDYSLETQAAYGGRFDKQKSPNLNYAYHLDAGLYARFLSEEAQKRGVERVQGTIAAINSTEEGSIKSLMLADGKELKGDFFIDCTGSKGLLLQKYLRSGYEDWSHWLYADSAIAIQTELQDKELVPFTKSSAFEAGWFWKIPLQHRVGNGVVYSSHWLSDEAAQEHLYRRCRNRLSKEPKVIKFRPGRVKQAWVKNCVGIGLSSGFIEPLESTSIHLIMTAIYRLIRLFPSSFSSNCIAACASEYNTQASEEIEYIRDFIIAHYHVNQRFNEPMWDQYRNMDVPGQLQHKLSLFKESGIVFQPDPDIFRIDSWVQVLLGQGVVPKDCHRIVSELDAPELRNFLLGLKEVTKNASNNYSLHLDFLKKFPLKAERK